MTRLYKYCFFVSLIFLVGCGAISKETLKMFSDATAHQKMVASFGGKDSYPDAYIKAYQTLLDAERAMQKKQDKQARKQAEESLQMFQDILADLYLHKVTPLAKEAKIQIETVIDEDPDTPLAEFLPKLNEFLDYSEKIAAGKEVIALSKVIEDLEDVIVIKRNAVNDTKLELKSDISFGSGKFHLSDEGKELMQDFFERVLADQRDALDQFIGETVTIQVTVIGYTDQQSFLQGTKLIENLLEGVEEFYPEERLEQRRFLNKRLSLFRAKSIGEYIQALVLQADPRIYIEQNIVNRGEDLPPKVTVNYPIEDSVDDPRRRICKVYSQIMLE